MSACAVMYVRDEVDIIEPVIRHLAKNVDHIVAVDNASTDGTLELLDSIRRDLGGVLETRIDPDIAYWQSRKMTALAREAYERGYNWVIPCDADEVWYADGRRLGDYLDGVAPDVQIVQAELYNHLPSADDPADGDPVARIGWRQRQRGALPKVACRCRPDLTINPGNHSATTTGTALAVWGLSIRHFSWRTPEQYVRKIRNGEAAYKLTTIDPEIGKHWRMWEGASDEAITDHFRRWFHSARPNDDASLMYDPAPIWR